MRWRINLEDAIFRVAVSRDLMRLIAVQCHNGNLYRVYLNLGGYSVPVGSSIRSITV